MAIKIKKILALLTSSKINYLPLMLIREFKSTLPGLRPAAVANRWDKAARKLWIFRPFPMNPVHMLS
jgi:hypothetical protein